MGVHDGHRSRLRETFLTHGIEGMQDVNALELLLFYAVPRRDTNELAHALLARFGSLEGVFAATREELCEVDGIGDCAAGLILLVPAMLKKSRLSRTAQIRRIRSSTDACNYFLPRFMNERDELVFLLCLDAGRGVICCEEMGRGVVNAVDTSIRRMVEKALRMRACSVIVAHNHPGGVALPSREDERFTRQLYSALDSVGVRLEDHIIAADESCCSLADLGILHPQF